MVTSINFIRLNDFNNFMLCNRVSSTNGVDRLFKHIDSQRYILLQDETAWLFNIRGHGTSSNEGLMHSPLFDSVALITLDDVFLWINTEKVAPGLLLHLTPSNCMENR